MNPDPRQILTNPFVDYALDRVFDLGEDRRYAHLILRLIFPEIRQLTRYFMVTYPACNKAKEKKLRRKEALCQQEQD